MKMFRFPRLPDSIMHERWRQLLIHSKQKRGNEGKETLTLFQLSQLKSLSFTTVERSTQTLPPCSREPFSSVPRAGLGDHHAQRPSGCEGGCEGKSRACSGIIADPPRESSEFRGKYTQPPPPRRWNTSPPPLLRRRGNRFDRRSVGLTSSPRALPERTIRVLADEIAF